jgi:hypothetical protein
MTQRYPCRPFDFKPTIAAMSFRENAGWPADPAGGCTVVRGDEHGAAAFNPKLGNPVRVCRRR